MIQDIALLVAALNKGDLILYPTETIWGIGCDATNEAAIQKVDGLKQRLKDKNYIVMVDSMEMLSQYLAYIPPKACDLIEYHKRPLTIVYDQPQNLPNCLLACDGTIAIRVTLDPFCKQLIKTFGKPIISTSANISGQAFPKSFMEIEESIKNGVQAIAAHQQSGIISNSSPSTIVKVIDGKDLIFLRK